MAPVLEITGLAKHFRKKDVEIVALRDFDLTVEAGTFVTILGRSGCGKSTLLNLVAGLTAPSAGEIVYRGTKLNGPRKDLGYLTQSDTLMPWRDILRNVEMPLELAGMTRQERRPRAMQQIDAVGLQTPEAVFHRPHDVVARGAAAVRTPSGADVQRRKAEEAGCRVRAEKAVRQGARSLCKASR